jgi:hypothetical protein
MEYEHLGMDQVQLDEVRADVRERYPHVEFPNVYHDTLWRGIGSRTKIEKRQAIVMEREGIEIVAGICSDDYMLIPHEWAIHRLEQAINGLPQYGKAVLNVALYGDGAKLKAEALFPEVEVKIGKDPINPRAGIKNSYDLSMEWESWFGAKILRCTNGMLMFKKLSNGGGKHRMSLDLESNIAQISDGMEKLDEQYQIWGKWFQLQIDQTNTMQMLEESPLSEKQVENILTLPEIGTNQTMAREFERGRKINGWFLSSVITQYMTHEMDDTPSRLNLEERMTNYLHTHLN